MFLSRSITTSSTAYTYVKVKRADKVRKAGDEARDGVPGFGNKS